MSRTLTIAREDVRRALRDRLAWAAVVLLGVMFLPSTASVARPRVHPIGEFLLLSAYELMTFVLVVVAAVGYGSVVGERTGGTIRFVLGLPGTRRDLVLGKLLSRAAIVGVALLGVLAVAYALVVRGYGKPYVASFWVTAGWMVLYGAVWSAVTVGYSAAFASQYRALGALVATYAAFSPDVGAWSVLVRPAFSLAFTGSLDAPAYETLASAPLWLRVTERLNPLIDFWQAVRWSVESVGPGTPAGGPGPHLLGTAAFLLSGAVPLVMGCCRFERADLGDDGSRSRAGRLRRSLDGIAETVAGGRVAVGSRTVPSRVRIVVGEDVRHALRNRVVIGAIALVAVLTGPRLWQTLDPDSIATVTETIAHVPERFTLPVLVLGIAAGYQAVVGERASGTARLVLGLPATRRDLVVGKALSRGMLTGLALLPVVLFAEAIVVTRFGGVYPLAFLAWAGWVLLFGVVWTSVVVGISAAVSSRFRALAAAFGTFLFFNPGGVGLWSPVVRPLVAFVFAGRFSARDFVQAADGGPLWFRYVDHLNPFVALDSVRTGLFVAAGHGLPHADVTAPLFVYSVAVALLFGAASLYLGQRRFDRAELG